MSIRATNWAAGQLLAPLQKLVLFVLGDGWGLIVDSLVRSFSLS